MTYDRIALRNEIEREEGRKAYAYEDSEGYLTIGIGHLVDRRKGGALPDTIINALFEYDIDETERQIDAHIPWWRQMSDARQRAILNMTFQLGIGGVLGFPAMLGALQAGRYQEAADEAMDSKWAKQTPERAARVSEMIRRG